MIHGPCGTLNRNSPCMVDGQCTKGFPKQFLQCTEQGNDSYPKYRRRKPDDGCCTGTINMRQYGQQIEQEVTNQWVVPYNPFLLRQFNCHINVEICSSIKSIKYVHKGNGPGGVRTAAHRAGRQPRAAKPAQGSGRDRPVTECQVRGQQQSSLEHPRTPHS